MGHERKKRYAIIFLLLCSCVAQVLAENVTEPPRRTFTGSVDINAGSYDDYYLRVVAQSKIAYARPGETVEFMLYVRRGDDPVVLHDVQVLDEPDAFALTFSPSSIPQVRNVDMVPIKTTLHVPLETPEGDYPVLIRVKGKEFVEDGYPLDLKVRVGSYSNWRPWLFFALTAGLIALLAWRIINIKQLGKEDDS